VLEPQVDFLGWPSKWWQQVLQLNQ